MTNLTEGINESQAHRFIMKWPGLVSTPRLVEIVPVSRKPGPGLWRGRLINIHIIHKGEAETIVVDVLDG